ncbi:conserved hypothetical protein [Psychrobacter arcticus 273-4]|uniref:DUF1232 domain-containing protein n=1 Tax=Psychrobacter arcticus (strain DSM 17307 / VKM B-2377 / 273-4) TaxID=259536 RepID=Q4FTG9_PSYA2|nr:YkvA family protein [Psychrobacter arcticus]AAZ18689.1 conserved hypothetical protein [Psychrobacter arcticus 273-4]
MADKEKEKEKDNKSLMDSIKLILGKEDRINDQLENGRGLERYTKDLLLLMSLVKDYYQGNYRNIPYKTISAAVVGLLYVINPIDLIPDFIPFIGQVDDALVLKFCLKLIKKDLLKYQTWKDKQTASEDKDSKPTNKKLEDKDKSTEKEGKDEKSKAEDNQADSKKSS